MEGQVINNGIIIKEIHQEKTKWRITFMPKFEKNGSWGEFLVVESKKINDAVDYINENEIKNIWISNVHGYKLKNLSFLKKITSPLEGLIVIDSNIELDGVNELTSLRMLSLSDEMGYKLDLSKFRYLKRCSLLWNKEIFNLSTLLNIEDLNIRKGTATVFTSDTFSGFKKLKELVLIECKMKDLAFLSNANQLEQLEVFYSPSLMDINAVRNCRNLEKLVFDHCKNIKGNYSVLSDLGKLSFLNITDSKEIETLSFI
jgi:hypothetical protein